MNKEQAEIFLNDYYSNSRDRDNHCITAIIKFCEKYDSTDFIFCKLNPLRFYLLCKCTVENKMDLFKELTKLADGRNQNKNAK